MVDRDAAPAPLRRPNREASAGLAQEGQEVKGLTKIVVVGIIIAQLSVNVKVKLVVEILLHILGINARKM